MKNEKLLIITVILIFLVSLYSYNQYIVSLKLEVLRDDKQVQDIIKKHVDPTYQHIELEQVINRKDFDNSATTRYIRPFIAYLYDPTQVNHNENHFYAGYVDINLKIFVLPRDELFQ